MLSKRKWAVGIHLLTAGLLYWMLQCFVLSLSQKHLLLESELRSSLSIFVEYAVIASLSKAHFASIWWRETSSFLTNLLQINAVLAALSCHIELQCLNLTCWRPGSCQESTKTDCVHAHGSIYLHSLCVRQLLYLLVWVFFSSKRSQSHATKFHLKNSTLPMGYVWYSFVIICSMHTVTVTAWSCFNTKWTPVVLL